MDLSRETDMEVMDFVLNKGHGVFGLAKTGIQTVPNRYVLPEKERFNPSITGKKSEHVISVIDISNIETDPEIGEKVCSAARKYGFFQIINHGIPEDILEAVQVAGRSFFEQSTEEKVEYKNNSLLRGSATFGTSFRPAMADWKDSLSLRYISDEDASQSWPPICKDESLEYRRRVMVVGKKIYDVLLKGLNINGWNDEPRRSVLTGSTTIQFNYYPPCPNPELTCGLAPHSDVTCITVLLQDDVGGLYVKAEEGGDNESWVYVPPTKGAMVVNIGDSMQILSNNHYKSVQHRVTVNAAKPRISVATFISPLHNQAVAPLPEVLAAGEKPVYGEVLFKDYLKYFLDKENDGKATIDYVKI